MVRIPSFARREETAASRGSQPRRPHRRARRAPGSRHRPRERPGGRPGDVPRPIGDRHDGGAGGRACPSRRGRPGGDGRAAAERASDRAETSRLAAVRERDETVADHTPDTVPAGPRPRASLMATLGLIVGVAAALAVLTGVLAGYGVALGVVGLFLSIGGISATGRRHVAGKSDRPARCGAQHRRDGVRRAGADRLAVLAVDRDRQGRPAPAVARHPTRRPASKLSRPRDQGVSRSSDPPLNLLQTALDHAHAVAMRNDSPSGASITQRFAHGRKLFRWLTDGPAAYLGGP